MNRLLREFRLIPIVLVAAARGAPLLLGGRDWTWQGAWRAFSAQGPWGMWRDLSLGLPGAHQVENACTALAALDQVNRAGVSIAEDAIRRGLANARWPGRFERHTIAGRDVVFDGAHTPAAAKALVETWQAEYGPSRATVVLGLGADKDASAFLAALRPIAARLYVTRADSPRAADPVSIAEHARQQGYEARTFPSVADAIALALATDTAPLLITGSLFVAGEGREALGLAEPDRAWHALIAAGRARTPADPARDTPPSREGGPATIR